MAARRLTIACCCLLVTLAPVASADPDPEPEPETNFGYTTGDSIAFIDHHDKRYNVEHGTFYANAEACVEELGISVGEKFLSCLMGRLRTEGSLADADPEKFDGYWRMLDDSYGLKANLRNLTCSMDDAGSPVIEKTKWTYDASAECAAASDRGIEGVFKQYAGFLPAGHDHQMGMGVMTVQEARFQCAKEPGCKGFTFNIPEADGEPTADTKTAM